MNQLRSFASSSGDRPSIFFSSFSTSVIDSFRVFGRWYFTPCYPPTKGRNDGQSLLDRLLPLRSEEHTSELQSQSNLVCRLLLEKKKKIEIKKDTSQNR